MRIIIQYYYDFLRKKTAAVDIEDEEQDCSILLKAISIKVDRPIHEFVATVKKDNVSVRIIQGWPISFFEIKDKSCLNVEFKDIESEESKKQGQALNNRYLMKLGINKMQDKNLSVIKDFDEEEGDEDNEGGENSFGRKKSNYNNKSERTSLKKIGSQNSNSSSSDEEGSRNKNIDIKKMLDNFLEQLISETKNNRLEEVKKLFNEVSDRLNQEQKDELQKKKLIIINELGKDGFNPLHIAVYNQFLEISKELVERGANVNVPNNQGWTSIQIAIHRNNLKSNTLLLNEHEKPTNILLKFL